MVAAAVATYALVQAGAGQAAGQNSAPQGSAAQGSAGAAHRDLSQLGQVPADDTGLRPARR